MGIVFAIIAALVTLVIAALITFSGMMSDAPMRENTSPFPTLIIGLGIAAALAFTHWHPIHWSW